MEHVWPKSFLGAAKNHCAFYPGAFPLEAHKDELKAYVKDNLASYKVPREIVFLDELPRNATGKVLKRELAEHEENGASSSKRDSNSKASA